MLSWKTGWSQKEAAGSGPASEMAAVRAHPPDRKQEPPSSYRIYPNTQETQVPPEAPTLAQLNSTRAPTKHTNPKMQADEHQ